MHFRTREMSYAALQSLVTVPAAHGADPAPYPGCLSHHSGLASACPRGCSRVQKVPRAPLAPPFTCPLPACAAAVLRNPLEYALLGDGDSPDRLGVARPPHSPGPLSPVRTTLPRLGLRPGRDVDQGRSVSLGPRRRLARDGHLGARPA